MVDDEPNDTVRTGLARAGASNEDAANAETLAVSDPGQTPPPLPPAPSAGEIATSPRRRRSDGGVTGQFGNRYTLRDRLGHGGMGEVLLAYDEQVGRDVAIKVIRSEHPNKEETTRFVREAQVQGRLEHPAVVPVHDIARDGSGRPYFVMKRLAGTDMHVLVKQLRTDPDAPALRRRLLRAFVDVCLCVEFAHSRGIVHRDLKPANIMLGEYGEVYVIDWGVARVVADDDAAGAPSSVRQKLNVETGDTQQGTVLGTPAYMAPEQLVGDRVGPAADVYALGCILYEITAGEPLFAHARGLGQAFEPVDARPSLRRPDAPPELDAICERAIRRDPTERYLSARALGTAVQAFLDGDRDVAVRQELARHHIQTAREAFARGTGEGDRRAAIQAAGRALALDPTASEAADLVTRLMLEPPATVPAEVDAQLALLDTDTARSQARLAAISMLGYLAFVPLLLWSGVRDLTMLSAFTALAIICGLHVLYLTRGERITPGPIYLNAAINAVLIGVVCRMVGPFIIAPTLVLTTLMAYASHPQFGRIRVLAAILSASVVIPWLLEIAGVLESTYRFEGGTLVLESDVVRFTSLPTQLAFALLLVSLLGVVAALSRTLATRQRQAASKLELQAWHLRQILPAAPR